MHSGFISGKRFLDVYPFSFLIRLPERTVIAFLTCHKLIEFGLPQTVERITCSTVFTGNFIGISNAVCCFLRARAVYRVNPYTAVFGVSFVAVSLRFSLIFNKFLRIGYVFVGKAFKVRYALPAFILRSLSGYVGREIFNYSKAASLYLQLLEIA